MGSCSCNNSMTAWHDFLISTVNKIQKKELLLKMTVLVATEH